MSGKIESLSNGVEGLFIRNMRFNTTLISFNFYIPLNRENVAVNALLPFVLTTCSKKYPDFSALNYKLNKLYGAELSASAEKLGDYQLLKMSISVIDDSFTLDGEPLCDAACELLTDMIFEPMVENGAFADEDVEREKRKAIEHIKGELSEKRTYAKTRLIEEMFKDDVYGAPKCGTVSEVEKVTGEVLYKAWQKTVSSAFVRVNVIGRNLPEGLFESISERFSRLERSDITDVKCTVPAKPTKKVNTVTERMDITQGKLVMGFSCESSGPDEVSIPMFVMCDMFGGGAYSRLFANVREKMSLCYYCLSSAVRIKGLMTVESGVEADNAEKAQKEILNQLKTVKEGKFDDFEFEASKKSLIDSFNSYDDSQNTIENWYSVKISNENLLSPQDVAEMVAKISREDVVTAAAGVKLHTVYKLLPEEENK